jgi:hypothetical protein
MATSQSEAMDLVVATNKRCHNSSSEEDLPSISAPPAKQKGASALPAKQRGAPPPDEQRDASSTGPSRLSRIPLQKKIVYEGRVVGRSAMQAKKDHKP